MNAFTPDELAAMAATQVEAMMDRCLVWKYEAGVVDPYGQRTPGYTVQPEIVPCGFAHSAPNSEADGAQQYGTNKGLQGITLRLPLATVVSAADRIEIVQRFGVAFGGEMYEVVGDPRQGPSGLVCDLAAVTA